jgi:hypothetical protein
VGGRHKERIKLSCRPNTLTKITAIRLYHPAGELNGCRKRINTCSLTSAPVKDHGTTPKYLILEITGLVQEISADLLVKETMAALLRGVKVEVTVVPLQVTVVMVVAPLL